MINVEITKGASDNSANMIRKFSRRMQGTGIVHLMRQKRYYSRMFSDAVRKKRALRRIQKQERFEQLLKEGKVAPRAPRTAGRR